MAELKEIYIGDHVIRKRDDKDLKKWFEGINSIVFPSSIKAKVNINGEWENCIVTGRVSETLKGNLDMLLVFADATSAFVSGPKNGFLPEHYIEAVQMEKDREAERRRQANAGRRKRIS